MSHESPHPFNALKRSRIDLRLWVNSCSVNPCLSWVSRSERPRTNRSMRILRSASGQVLTVFSTPAKLLIWVVRSEEHTSELQSLMRNSYAVFCLKQKHKHKQTCM